MAHHLRFTQSDPTLLPALLEGHLLNPESVMHVEYKMNSQEAVTSRHLNRVRKKLRCLGCGREMMTDRCHRFCNNC